MNNFKDTPSFNLFREAVAKRVAPLVIVTGSGASAAANIPTWPQLKGNFEKDIRQMKNATNNFGNNGRSVQLYKNLIDSKDDYWEFFEIAQDILTEPTFDSLIKKYIDTPSGSSPSYNELLRLNPSGLVTLNIDRLAGEAITQYSNDHIIPIYGHEICKKWGLLNEERPFLVYLHGHISEPESWIFTKTQFKKLSQNEGWKQFQSRLFLDNTVLFYGLSADDVAISKRIIDLKNAGFRPPRLYWLTSRKDYGAETWARDNYVQIIQYEASNNEEHQRNLKVFCDSVVDALPPEEQLPPTHNNISRSFDLEKQHLEPRKLGNYDADFVRKYLSNTLKNRLSNSELENLYETYDLFVKEFAFPIKTKAFYEDNNELDRVFFDYSLTYPQLGRGNFGKVFSATNTQGDSVAIKIMHSSIMENRDMIGGFRRGIRSMKILSDANISGISKIIESFEMPPTIVMEHISGNSFEEIFNLVGNIPWNKKIEMLLSMSEIIDSCHKLPEMVLHRDIKPSNVMIVGLDYEFFDFDSIFVLDFDMSWHKNSSERDVVFETRDDFAYLAPEQTDTSRRVNTRTAKVDSYGFAMTMFALFGAEHPTPSWTLTDKWPAKVKKAVSLGYNHEIKCIPTRAIRIILESTTIDQSIRLDFSTIVAKLRKIHKSLKQISIEDADIDIQAEEFLAQISGEDYYTWSDLSDNGSITLYSGVKIDISVNKNYDGIIFSYAYTDAGARNFKHRNSVMGEVSKILFDLSKSIDAKIERNNISNGQLNFIFSRRGKIAAGDSAMICAEIAKCNDRFRSLGN